LSSFRHKNKDNNDVLVGLDSPDDGGVILLPNGSKIVQTVDFFTPILDDPYDWGRVAATNALSDIYAMGGQPISALQLVSWPRDEIGFDGAGKPNNSNLCFI
jgi:selenide,water dikinase